MKIVIDTNQLFKMASKPRQSPLFIAWRDDLFVLIMSKPLLTEFETAAKRPKIERFLHPTKAEGFQKLLVDFAVFVEPVPHPPSCRDPKDEIVIATALAGEADFIITTDKDLLDDEELKTTLRQSELHVLLPNEFYKII